MSAPQTTEQLSLNSTLIQSIVDLVDFYSKKGVFKLNEYKDIATINERLVEVKTGLDGNTDYVELTSGELAFIIQIFKEGSTRIPTAIDSFGQLYSIYQHFKTVLEQKVAAEEAAAADVPRVEELSS